MTRRLAISLLLGLSLAAAPAASAALACQPETDCCCCPSSGAHAAPMGCQMNCADPSAAERLSAVHPVAETIRLWPLLQLEPLAPDATSPADRTASRLALATASHSPPQKRYLLACVLRL